MKKIIILFPKNIKNGQPSFERINAYKEYFSKNIEVIEREFPSSIREEFALIRYMYQEKIYNIFISMPPFRNWMLFIVPNLKIILDIRDGWSIAMKTGYGGTVKKQKYKYKLAQYIEKIAIKKAALVITCTPGLQEYLENLSKKKVLLITNGYSKENQSLVSKLSLVTNNNEKELNVVCAGKFSEYGNEKVKKMFSKISKEYEKKNIKFIVVGADKKSNNWIFDYLKYSNINNIEFILHNRVSKKELYQIILNSDMAVSIIRDPNYDFGTKIFDYILCEVPLYNYFNNTNSFSNYFKDAYTYDKDKFRRDIILNENQQLKEYINENFITG